MNYLQLFNNKKVLYLLLGFKFDPEQVAVEVEKAKNLQLMAEMYNSKSTFLDASIPVSQINLPNKNTLLQNNTLSTTQLQQLNNASISNMESADTSSLISAADSIDTGSLVDTASSKLSPTIQGVSKKQITKWQRSANRQARQEAFKENMQNLGDGLKNFVTSKEGLTMGANLATGAINALDLSFMGNKNFSSLSGAVDTVVHGASAALINSGNPIAMGVGVGLEALNFSTKANGDTVQGFDINIDSSGYGNIGHMESKSNRDWGAMIGLGGLFGKGKIEKQLLQRNALAQMALKAAEITDDIKFEQEARMSSVSHTLQNNAVALAGGVDTSVLAAKKGTKLSKLKDFHKEFVKKAKYGAKLKLVELSDTPNVLPVGAMHKELNHLDDELDITRKGIPVIQGVDDNALTKEDIKEQADNMIQAAEIEAAEIIFNKEVTELLEDLRKKWNDSDRKDDELCYEAGLKIVKEILFNTIDEDAIIKGIKKNESSRD